MQDTLGIIFESIRQKKGENIIHIDITALKSSICNHFVICHGHSNIQVNAISKAVEESLLELYNMTPFHKEGYQNAFWILLDFGDIIVHIFQEAHRQFYNLEDLWADGRIRQIES